MAANVPAGWDDPLTAAEAGTTASAGADGTNIGSGGSTMTAPADTAGDSSAGDGGSAPLSTSVLPYCLANATTRVSIQANIDSLATVPASRFDIDDPANTSNFSTSLSVVDACGRAQNLGVFFAHTAERTVAFHVITVDPPISELCGGSLLFDANGALASVTRTKPCQLSSGEVFVLNLGTPTDAGGSGTDGVMYLGVPSNVRLQQIDGNPSEVGVACTADQKRSASTPASCTADPTRVLALEMNLSTHEPVQTPAWSPDWPDATSNVHLRFTAQQTRVQNANFDFYLRREAAQLWTYHVLLAGPAAPLELASGMLQFDAVGRLLVTGEFQTLRFPFPDGSFGDPIAIDLGAPVSTGGNGVDGVTNFTTATVYMSGDGEAVSDWPAYSTSACPGLATHTISEWWMLPSDVVQGAYGTPWPETPNATATVYDEQTNAWALALFWHGIGANQVAYKLVASLGSARIESSVGSLLFNASGRLQHADRASVIRLPLSDGSPGPGFALDIGPTIDEGGNFNAISTSNLFALPDFEEIDLLPDGFPSSTPCP